jgi:hypothetical protein
MATSTIPAAKAALIALLKAATYPAGQPAIDYGDPGVAKVEHEHIWLGGTGQDGQDWAPYGQLKREEEYALELYVHVANPGTSQQEATERAYALFGVIESTIRAQARTASSTVATGVWSIGVKPTALTEFVTAEGYAAFVSAEIEIKARI